MNFFYLLTITLVSGVVMPAGAQEPASALAGFIGTWEKSAGPGLTIRCANEIYRRLVVRSDSAIIWSTICVEGSDTLSRVSAFRIAQMRKDHFGNVPSVILDGDTIFIKSDQKRLVMQGQQLAVTSMGSVVETYQRATSLKRPFDVIVASGFRSGRPIPSHAQTPTGTLTDLIGTWKSVDTTNEFAPFGESRQFVVIRQDSTWLKITYNAQLGVASARTASWKDWKRIPNDSIITRGDADWQARLNNERLAIYGNGRKLPPQIFEPVDALPKQP